MKSILHIEKVLRQELTLYAEICDLEERKGAAIIARDGKLLESLSLEQESALTGIHALEEARLAFIESFAREQGLDGLAEGLALRDILGSLEGEAAERTRDVGVELKNLLVKIQALAETNEKLALDNIEFFNILLSEVKGRVSLKTGYNREAVEKRTIENPLLFNRRA